jgi:hypothetical protein
LMHSVRHQTPLTCGQINSARGSQKYYANQNRTYHTKAPDFAPTHEWMSPF